MRHTHIHIHKDHLAHNANLIKSQTKAKLLAMVKANAYGHQVRFAVPALDAADGFGVACMQEALAVKACMDDDDPRPIVLMEGAFSLAEWQQACQENLMCVIHHQLQLDYACQHIPPYNHHTRTVWLKYNTGMNRLGFDKDSLVGACDRLVDNGYQVILCSHFACADDKTHPQNTLQINAFVDAYHTLKARHPSLQASFCNSAGIFNFPHVHYDWVRSGIALYGSSPVNHLSATALGLKAAMTFSAKIIALHTVKKGQNVGYGALWQAHKDSQIALISAGYGDGYPRVVSKAVVRIKGTFAPIVGRISMDMMAIDVSGLSAKIGDEVVLWGNDLSIDRVANCAGTIGYELLCRLSGRPTFS